MCPLVFVSRCPARLRTPCYRSNVRVRASQSRGICTDNDLPIRVIGPGKCLVVSSAATCGLYRLIPLPSDYWRRPYRFATPAEITSLRVSYNGYYLSFPIPLFTEATRLSVSPTSDRPDISDCIQYHSSSWVPARFVQYFNKPTGLTDLQGSVGGGFDHPSVV